MIDSDASVHVCPLKNGQGNGFRKSNETRPLPGAEKQQREMRQMNYDSEAGRITAVYRVLDMRRSIWSLKSMLDSGFDVYFTMDRRWIAKNNGKELDVIFSSGVFFVAAKPSKLLSRKKSALELTSMSQAEVERATSTSVRDLESLTLRRETRWTEMNRRCVSEFPQARLHPQLKRRSCTMLCTMLRDTRSIADGVDGVLQREQQMNRI